MGVRASMSVVCSSPNVPILCQLTATCDQSIIAFGKLWGLITCHSYGPHGARVSSPVRQILRLLSDTISRNIERLSCAKRVDARKIVRNRPAYHFWCHSLIELHLSSCSSIPCRPTSILPATWSATRKIFSVSSTQTSEHSSSVTVRESWATPKMGRRSWGSRIVCA